MWLCFGSPWGLWHVFFLSVGTVLSDPLCLAQDYSATVLKRAEFDGQTQSLMPWQTGEGLFFSGEQMSVFEKQKTRRAGKLGGKIKRGMRLISKPEETGWVFICCWELSLGPPAKCSATELYPQVGGRRWCRCAGVCRPTPHLAPRQQQQHFVRSWT